MHFKCTFNSKHQVQLIVYIFMCLLICSNPSLNGGQIQLISIQFLISLPVPFSHKHYTYTVVRIWKPDIQMVFQSPNHHSVTGPLIGQPFKLNSNRGPFQWSDYIQPFEARPFDDRTTFDHLDSGLICYSDPHCRPRMQID